MSSSFLTPNVPVRAGLSGSDLVPDRPGVASQLVPALVADRIGISGQPHNGDSGKNEGDGGNELSREKEGAGDAGIHLDQAFRRTQAEHMTGRQNVKGSLDPQRDRQSHGIPGNQGGDFQKRFRAKIQVENT